MKYLILMLSISLISINGFSQSVSPISPGASEKAVAAPGATTPSVVKVVAGVRGSTVIPLSVNASGQLEVSASIVEAAVAAIGAAPPSEIKVGGGLLGATVVPFTFDSSKRLIVSDKLKNGASIAKFQYSTGTPITSSAYTEILQSHSVNTNEVEIFDSSGQTIFLAIGGSGSESNKVYVLPGGNGRIPLILNVGDRISLKSAGPNVDVGEIVLNFFQ
jgi:hypothetical protein